MTYKEINGYERVVEFITDTLYEHIGIIGRTVPGTDNYTGVVKESMYIIENCTDILYCLNNHGVPEHKYTEGDHELFDLLRSEEATDNLEKIKGLQAKANKEDVYGWEYKVPYDKMVFLVKDIMDGEMMLQTKYDLVHSKWFPGYKYHELRRGYND